MQCPDKAAGRLFKGVHMTEMSENLFILIASQMFEPLINVVQSIAFQKIPAPAYLVYLVLFWEMKE